MFDKKIKDDIIGLEMNLFHFKSQLSRVFAYEVHRISDEIKKIENDKDIPKELMILRKGSLLDVKISLIRIHDDIDKIKIVQTEHSKDKYGLYPKND